MLRTIKIGALVALVVLGGATGVPSAAAQTLTWGVFRENAASISESLRNCWTQAMVSGQTINGELMAQNLTERKAGIELQRLARQGLCAAERTSTSWSARGQEPNRHGDSDDGWSSHGGGSGSDWSRSGSNDDATN